MATAAPQKLAIAGQELRPIGRIGEGTYACVLLAAICKNRTDTEESGASHANKTSGLCAIKMFKSKSNEAVRLAKREAVAHAHLNGHPNIVHLRGAYRSGGGRPILLMEYCPRDLLSDMRLHPAGLPGVTVKLLAWQLLQAFRFMHGEKYLHWDLKPTNLLLTAEGVLKVSDFGLAREAPLMNPRTGAPGERLTKYVVTRWYRAPEVLLNKPYGTAADIWSVGCTVAEMAIGVPLLPGKSSVDQIFQIWRMFGSLPQQSKQAAPAQRSMLRVHLATLLEGALIDVLEAALRTNPAERATAEELLYMPYFAEIPDLVVGTALEDLYDWSGREGATVKPSINVFRKNSLLAEELDLPSKAERSTSRAAATEETVGQWLSSAISSLVADASVVTPVRQGTAIMPVSSIPRRSGEIDSHIAGDVGNDAAATATAAVAAVHPLYDSSMIGSGWGTGIMESACGLKSTSGVEFCGNAERALLRDCRPGVVCNGDNPRVGEDPTLAVACAHAGSVPMLDRQGLTVAPINLRRTTSVVLSGKVKAFGDDKNAGDGSAGDVGGGGGGGGGGIKAGRGWAPQPRAGSRVITSSLRRFFAQSRPESTLSTWQRSQWDLTTITGADRDPMQLDLTGPITGRFRGLSTTAMTIPENSPLLDPDPDFDPVQDPGLQSSVPGPETTADGVSSASPTTASMTADMESDKAAGTLQQQWQQQQQKPAGLVPIVTLADPAPAAVQGITIPYARTSRCITSFVTPSLLQSSTETPPPPPPPPQLAEMLTRVPDIEGGGVGVGGVGMCDTDEGARHSGVITQVADTNSPRTFESAKQSSVGGQRAGNFVLQIMHIIRENADTNVRPVAPLFGSVDWKDVSVGQHWPLMAAPQASAADPEPACLSNGAKEISQIGSAAAAASDSLTTAPLTTTAPWGRVPSVSRSADAKCESTSGDAPEALGAYDHNTAYTAPSNSATWAWNCTTDGVSGGSRSYGCVGLAEKEKAALNFGGCAKERVQGDTRAAQDGGCRRARAEAPCLKVDCEEPRGLSFGCLDDNERMACVCAAPPVAAARVTTAAPGRERGAYPQRFLHQLRKLVLCGTLIVENE